jgi:undecaprenyl-diphosphatase
MRGMSWLGFPPQVLIIEFVLVAALFATGLRWESIGALFVAGNAPLSTLIKLMVMRPRPGADLVEVTGQISSSGFPSGHVLAATTICGYLAFLAFTLLKPSWHRTLIVGLLVLFVLLMGCSRIYLGQHWFSDVIGAYLLGSLYLALTIKFYRWGKQRFFRDQPVAPESVPAR